MRALIKKWGNSLALRIPKTLAAEHDLQHEREVEVFSEERGIVIQPKRYQKRYSAKELVEQITPHNRHEEIDFGPPAGKEIW